MSALEQVLTDLAAEGDELAAHLATLDEQQWYLDTPAEGWTVAHQVAHLAWTDHVAVLAAGARDGAEGKQAWDEVVLQAFEDPTGFVDASAQEWAQLPREELIVRWQDGRARLAEVLRGYPAGEKLPWFGPPMSATSMATARFMETWAHARDVYDGLALLVAPTDRIRHVVHLGVRTRDFAYSVHEQQPPSEEFRLELVAPSGETWTYGPEDAAQKVVGSAYDFCLLVTQRRHRDDLDLVATGDDAAHWLTIAQAFAGPPGTGRAATGAAS